MKQNYLEWVDSLVLKHKVSRFKASIKVNVEFLNYLYELGKEINTSNFKKDYGDKIYDVLAEEFKKKGFGNLIYSADNLRYVEQFYILYKNQFTKLSEEFALLSWSHHRLIVERCSNDFEKAWFYIKEAITQKWEQEQLFEALNSDLYEKRKEEGN